MTPSVIPFWNRLTKCNNILKEKVKKIVIGKIFFFDFTSDSAKSNLANVGGILTRIKNFFLQRWFLIGSSIRFQTGVTFEEELYIITNGYLRSNFTTREPISVEKMTIASVAACDKLR